MIVSWLLAMALMSHAQTAATGSQLVASYPALPGGRPCESIAMPLNEQGLLVTVFSPGANINAPSLRSDGRSLPLRVIGHDPVTRLGFLQLAEAGAAHPAEWLSDARGCIGTQLRAEGAGSPIKCLAAGWVKQIGGKVLPLALMQVNFDRSVPSAGTPLIDAQGKVTGIVFQGVGGNAGYAIPAEAVHRVRRDVCNGGRLVRGWLGLTLNPESDSPRVVRVFSQSPAAGAGVLPGDVLLAVGSRQIRDYADAANAFFYLVPQQATQVKLMRGGRPLVVSITPGMPRAE
jgi:S1-C subfamily serine protease